MKVKILASISGSVGEISILLTRARNVSLASRYTWVGTTLISSVWTVIEPVVLTVEIFGSMSKVSRISPVSSSSRRRFFSQKMSRM